MSRNADTSEGENFRLQLGWQQEAGIPIIHIKSPQLLPPPTSAGHHARRILEQLRMKKRVRLDYDGEFDPAACLDALGYGELDRPFYRKTVRISRFELLFLFDVSGSMTIGDSMLLTELALADAVFAVEAIRSKAHMWAFSDQLYMFDAPGRPQAPGIRYGSTSMVQALDVAHKWGHRSPTTRSIILVTDGWPTSCRAKNSKGNPISDLHDVLQEMRDDKIPLSVLAIRQPSEAIEASKKMYDQAFGTGNYAMVATRQDIQKELPTAVRILASAHINKNARR
jgi:hypothetical protein